MKSRYVQKQYHKKNQYLISEYEIMDQQQKLHTAYGQAANFSLDVRLSKMDIFLCV